MRFIAALVLLASLAARVYAQSPDEFEVASVRPSAPGARFTQRYDRAQFAYTAVTLQGLIMSAYPDTMIESWKIAGGPSWLTTESWAFSAKFPSGMPADHDAFDRRAEQMLRNFLAEEFRLKVHRETKEQPVYALIVASGGPKFKRSEESEENVRVLKDGFDFRHISMANFVSFLYRPHAYMQAADRPVIDKTGLTGFYDITLEWTPDRTQASAPDGPPPIYTAIEQLGLRLRPDKAQTDLLVIDHAERPGAN